MKPRIVAIAAAATAVFGVTSTFMLHASATPTPSVTPTTTPTSSVTVSATNRDGGCMLQVTGKSVVPADLYVNGVQSYSIAPTPEAPPFTFEVFEQNGVKHGANHVEILGKDGRALAETTAHADCQSTKPTATPSPTWGWPQASFKGRTMTVTNVKPGWNIGVTATNTKTRTSWGFSAKAKSGSVTIQLGDLPNGTYDFWIDAGDLPANESSYRGIEIGSDTTPKPTRTPSRSGGLASTGV